MVFYFLCCYRPLLLTVAAEKYDPFDTAVLGGAAAFCSLSHLLPKKKSPLNFIHFNIFRQTIIITENLTSAILQLWLKQTKYSLAAMTL